MSTYKFYDHKNCPACAGCGSLAFGTDGGAVCGDCHGLGEIPKNPDDLRAEGIMLLAEVIKDMGFENFMLAVAQVGEVMAREKK